MRKSLAFGSVPRLECSDLLSWPTGIIRAAFLFGGTTMQFSLSLIRDSRGLEFHGREKQFALLPEHHLMIAVLEDAIACYMTHLTPRSLSGKTLFDDAERWFFSEGGDWLFSFTNICQSIGLSPNYVRRGLLNAKDAALAAWTGAKIYRLDDHPPALAKAHDCAECAAKRRPAMPTKEFHHGYSHPA
jgi:hypothetical protein